MVYLIDIDRLDFKVKKIIQGVILMITKKMFLLLFLPMCLYLYPMTPPSEGMGGFNPNMSEEEMMNLLKEQINAGLRADLEEKGKNEEEIEEAFTDFWNQVEEETERLEQETAHMEPDEKEQYLLNLINGETKPEEFQVPEIEEKPVVKDIPKVKPKPSIPLEKKEEIMSTISQIATSIESFLTKAAAFPDFDIKILHWLQKGYVTDWQADSWESFQHELNKFVHTLYRFKEKDPKIGFKHLDALLKQEAIIQNLKQLQKKLADYETKIQPIQPDALLKFKDMSTQIKNAAINTINSLTESLYRTKLPQELQKIIEEFDPIAKKLREEEEKATKEALTRSKRFEPTVPIRTAGQPPRRGDFALPSLDDLGLTGRATPRTADRSRTKPGGPSDTKKDAQGKGAKGGSDGSAKSEADKATKEGEKKAKAALDKKKKEEEAKKKKAAEAKKDTGQITHDGIKSNIDEFRKDVKETYNVILETPEFTSDQELKSYLHAAPPAPRPPVT